jgi:hypothetical protein
VASCYYNRDQYWDSPPEMEFSPEYMEFARRAAEAGVTRGGEALHPVTTARPTIHADVGAATPALSWTVAAYAPTTRGIPT